MPDLLLGSRSVRDADWQVFNSYLDPGKGMRRTYSRLAAYAERLYNFCIPFFSAGDDAVVCAEDDAEIKRYISLFTTHAAEFRHLQDRWTTHDVQPYDDQGNPVMVYARQRDRMHEEMLQQLVKRLTDPGTHGTVAEVGGGGKKWIEAFAKDTTTIDIVKQMADVLELDYFTCASLLIEARDDFDTADIKPIIRGIHAYYSSMESIFRAIFYLLRLRRDTRRCAITAMVDDLLKAINLDDVIIKTLLDMMVEPPKAGKDHDRMVCGAANIEMLHLKEYRTKTSPPLPLFSGDAAEAREVGHLDVVLERVQAAMANTFYAAAEQSTLPVDPNPDSVALADDPSRPQHFIVDTAPEFVERLFEMECETARQIVELLMARVARGMTMADSLNAGLLLGLVAVTGRQYMVTERAYEACKVAEHPLGLVDAPSDGAEDPSLRDSAAARAVAGLLSKAHCKDDDVDLVVASRYRLIRFLVGMLTHNERLLEEALVRHSARALHQIVQEGRQTSGGAFECLRLELLKAPQFKVRSEMLMLFHDELHATVLQPLVTTERWWRHLRQLRNFGHDYELFMRESQMQNAPVMRYATGQAVGLPKFFASDFSDMMLLAGDFYSMLAQRDAMKSWAEFAAESSLKLVQGLSLPFLHMLAGLTGPDVTQDSTALEDEATMEAIVGNAAEVFAFLRDTDAPETSNLRDHGKPFSWLETLNMFVQKVADDLDRQAAEERVEYGGQPAPPGPLDTKGSDAVVRLSAFLRLLHRVYNNANAQGAHLPAPDEEVVPIWRLFVARVHRSVKAEALLVLEAFCKVSDPYASFMCVRMASLFNRKASIPAAAIEQEFTQFQVDVATLEISDQEFPLTRALLSILHTLVPRLPAAGDTYLPELRFIDRYVFRAAFSAARYRNENEKWSICNKVLRLYVTLLESYEPLEQHFRDIFVSGAERAGFDLLSTCLQGMPDTEGDKLFQVFRVISEGAIHPNANKGEYHADFQSAVHYALEMLILLLQKQGAFTKLYRDWCIQSAAQGQVVARGQLRSNAIQQHIMKPCGARGACTRVLSIGRLVYEGVGFEVDNVALSAIKVLWHLSSPESREQHALVDIFKRDSTVSDGVVEYVEMKKLIQSFSMRLQGEVGALPLIAARPARDVFEFQHTFASSAIQHSIVHFILRNVCKRFTKDLVTLGHYLLGYGRSLTYTNDVATSRLVGLQLGYRTCFKEMLSLVRTSFSNVEHVDPVLAELIFKLIYKMCYLPHTSRPTLEYLRSAGVDFFKSHLDPIMGVQPVLPERGKNSELNRRRRDEGDPELVQPSREYCAELSRQGWLFKSIAIEVFTSLRGSSSRQPHDASYLIERMLLDVGSTETEVLLLRLLKPVSFHRSPVYLDVAEESEQLKQQINSIFRECVQPRVDMDGVLWCDCALLIDRLHDLQSQSVFAGAAFDQQKFQARFAQYYRSAIQMNEMWQASHAKATFFDGWRRAIGVCLKLRPPHHADRFIPHILCELLNKIREKDGLERVPELLAPVAEVVVLLTNKLRDHYAGLGGQAISSAGSSGLGGAAGGVLTQILRGITSAVRTSGRDRQARQSFYSALLSFYTIASSERRTDGVDEAFLALACRDAADSSGLLSALALSTITTIIRLNQKRGSTFALDFLQRRGILRQLAHQIRESDGALLTQIEPVLKGTLEPLNLHCARMGLLNQVVLDPAGAAAVADSEALWELRHCRFVSPPGGRPPEDDEALRRMNAAAGQLPQQLTTPVLPRAERHRQLVVPILHLAVSTLQKAVGSRRRVVLDQILHFVDAHAEEYFKAVLQNTARLATTGSVDTLRASPLAIEELGVITALVRQISGPRDASAVNEILGRNVERFENLMMSLLPVLANPDEMLSKFNYDTIGKDAKREVKRGLMNALANVVGYVHTRMGGGLQTPGTGQPLGLIVPKLMPALAPGSGPPGAFYGGVGVSPVSGVASLASAVQILRAAHNHYLRMWAAQDGSHSPAKRLRDGLDGDVHSKGLALFIIETTLWILWRHFDFYINAWKLTTERQRADNQRLRDEFSNHVDFREEPDSLLSVLVTDVEKRARMDAEAELKQSRGGGVMEVEINVVEEASLYRPIIEPIVQQIFHLRRALER